MSTGHATAVTEPADLPVERRDHPADIAEPTPVALAARTGTPITTPQWEGTAS